MDNRPLSGRISDRYCFWITAGLMTRAELRAYLAEDRVDEMSELDPRDIEQIVKRIATANLSRGSVQSVVSQPMIDSEGQEAVQITITLTSGSTASVKGDAALNTFIEIKDKLRDQGDTRFPFVEFREPAKRGGHR
jgi:hypothetical protein